MTRSVAVGFVDLVAPPVCAFCGNEVDVPFGEAMLCQRCRQDLSLRADTPRCTGCGKTLAPEFEGHCPDCHARRPRFDRLWTWGCYEGPLRRALLRLKKPGHEMLADALTSLFWRKNGDQIAQLPLDAVVPVPMHWSRRIVRGTNNAAVLAECLARRLKVRLESGLLVRRRNTNPHSGLTHRQRRINIRGALAVRRGYDLSAARILLVYDILTTGATCGEAARVMKASGTTWVGVGVVAKTDAPN